MTHVNVIGMIVERSHHEADAPSLADSLNITDLNRIGRINNCIANHLSALSQQLPVSVFTVQLPVSVFTV